MSDPIEPQLSSDSTIFVSDEVVEVIEQAIQAAKAYDGSEASYKEVFATSIAFEKCAKEILGETMGYSERENALSQRFMEEPLTTLTLLQIAVDSFSHRLNTGLLSAKALQTQLTFIPPASHPHILSGSEAGVEKAVTAPRTAEFIQLLNEHDPPIFIDDIIIYRGATPSHALRQVPYNLIQIPRLDREILICDQVGEACYVGQGQRGPLFWATYSKPELLKGDTVSRIIHNEKYQANLMAALFEDNVLQPKFTLRPPRQFPLSADIVLIHALKHAEAHDGILPTQYTGPIMDIPGQTWLNWYEAIARQLRQFDIDGLRGLKDLFNLYGLKIGRVENHVAIQDALKNIRETGHHGLEQQEKVILTADFILTKALEHAKANGGHLPQYGSGEVLGMPGQLWATWSAAMPNQVRGFDLPNIRGLNDLYNLYGLKVGRGENSLAIAAALKSIEETGHHGLEQQERVQLTADFILKKALEHAKANGGELPHVNSGEVIGMPGQIWQRWNISIREGNRGFDIENVGGLHPLFSLFGLRVGLSDNPQAIQEAIDNLEKTGEHGLKQQEEIKLTADYLLIKALEHAKAHNGQLPNTNSGEVIGVSGQHWDRWNDVIALQARGFDIEGLVGLNDLFNLYGLKIGNVDNPEAVARALKNIDETGHHGLERQELVKLTADFLLRKALEHAKANGGQLPTVESEVIGMPGQVWNTWTYAIRFQARGFDIPDVAGLNDFYNLYGLRGGFASNPLVIQEAIERLEQTGEHGLVIQEKIKLTADFILKKALEHAAVHGRLPSLNTGEVLDMPGQTWRAWNHAVRLGLRGFEIEGLSGLGQLYNIFGLKTGMTENKEVIQSAIQNLENTDHHGLTHSDPTRSALDAQAVKNKLVCG
ncbi:MAG: hypothetical protein WAO98_06755 [Alphaproteobacteria bacterium]